MNIYNKSLALIEEDPSLYITFDISSQEGIQHLHFNEDDSYSEFMIDKNKLQGFMKITKYDSTDTRYEDMPYFNIDLIKKNLHIINASKFIKNISVQYSIGSQFSQELKYTPDRLFLDFIAMLQLDKSLTIYLLKHLPKDFSDILEKLASLCNNIQELNIYTFRADFPKELICFKDIALKKICLGAFQWKKGLPKFLYEFTSSLEELILDYSITKLPKQIEKFQNLVYLRIYDLLEKSFPESFKNMNNLKAIHLEYLDEFPILPANIIPNISYLAIYANKYQNLDEIKKYSNLESLTLGSFCKYIEYNKVSEYRKDIKAVFKKTPKGCFPMEILELKNLKYLSLVQTNITYIPTEIIQLDNLEYLDLRFTKLKSLPENIYELKNLKYINIYGSMIKLDEKINFSNIEIIKK